MSTVKIIIYKIIFLTLIIVFVKCRLLRSNYNFKFTKNLFITNHQSPIHQYGVHYWQIGVGFAIAGSLPRWTVIGSGITLPGTPTTTSTRARWNEMKSISPSDRCRDGGAGHCVLRRVPRRFPLGCRGLLLLLAMDLRCFYFYFQCHRVWLSGPRKTTKTRAQYGRSVDCAPHASSGGRYAACRRLRETLDLDRKGARLTKRKKKNCRA